MTVDPPHGPRSALRRHREVLGVVTLALALSLLLEVVPGGRVAFRGLTGYPLPHSCATRSLFGFDCPACGLTRSLIHLAHGNWSPAIRCHRLGMLMAFAMLVQFPYRLYGLIRREPSPLGRIVPKIFGYGLIAALIGNWIYNQVTQRHA